VSVNRPRKNNRKRKSFFCIIAISALRIVILSMNPDIHKYLTGCARVWKASYVHVFHGTDIYLLMEWAQAEVHPVDI
jgi:hypothetical protein